MTGENLLTHQLPRAARACEPVLKRQFPWTESPEMRSALAELTRLLEAESGRARPDIVVTDWLKRVEARYGEYHEVEALEVGYYEAQDPVFEALGMVGGDLDRVLTYEAGK